MRNQPGKMARCLFHVSLEAWPHLAVLASYLTQQGVKRRHVDEQIVVVLPHVAVHGATMDVAVRGVARCAEERHALMCAAVL